MHVRKLDICDIRAIKSFDVHIPEPRAGWHVILGDNGSGKSSVVRALALALIGPANAPALRQDWADWIRSGAGRGHIGVELDQHAGFDKWTGKGRQFRGTLKLSVRIEPPPSRGAMKGPSSTPQMTGNHSKRSVWGSGAGWFSASFGPFRRFSGGDKDYDKLFVRNPVLAPHLSAFGEDVALGEALQWLQELRFKTYEQDTASTRLMNALLDFMRQSDLLPHGARIDEVTSEAVLFRDGAGARMPVEQLSDGFRSVLSMTFELLRGMAVAYGHEVFLDALDPSDTAIRLPGVVAIDEIDAHLHPAWQKRIGDWLVERFPDVQFFVTTHSPIICRSAVHGTIWRLPTPGSEEEPHQIVGQDRERLIHGNILDALDTAYFGDGVTRSDASYEMMEELATLNMRRSRGPLSEEEEGRRQSLQRTLPSVSAISE